MNKVLKLLDKIEELLLVSMFAGMVLVIFFQVIMRYAFNNSLPWSEELGKFFFVWISWLGISIGAKRGEHIKITMFSDKVSFKTKHMLNILSETIVIIICAITVFYGIELVKTQSIVPYAGIKISMAWGYLSVVVGCSLMILRDLISIVDSISAIKKGDDN